MKEIYTDIEIQASVEKIWKILTDFTHFSQWNPFIHRISGKAVEGEQLEVVIQPPGSTQLTFRPKVLKAEPNRELRWLGHLFIPGLFDGEHIFTIDPVGGNRTRFIQREVFQGLLTPLLARQLDRNTRYGFEAMNIALKRQAEQF